jgi:hypothetical protein
MKRNGFPLFGAAAVLLTATLVLTLFSRATPFASGIGGLKCYDAKGELEKCSGVDRPPLIQNTTYTMRH